MISASHICVCAFSRLRASERRRIRCAWHWKRSRGSQLQLQSECKGTMETAQ